MPRIARDSLMTLEAYAKARKDFRAKVMAHKKTRAVHLGEHLTLLFEDELTIRYQIQEILRIEKTFEEQAIEDELDAYNPLVPDGHNWKATLLVEYEEVEERKQALARLKGVEARVWVQVGTSSRVYAIADEDLKRENDEKTSAVHFMRFELTRPMVDQLHRGSALAIGVDHPAYAFTLSEVAEPTRRALLDDLLID
jgi:TusA-related sulfurtransferase